VAILEEGLNMVTLTLGRELKLVGFFINICTSLFLITSVMFGKGKPSLWDCITKKKPWKELWALRFYEIDNLNKNAFIASALVIIGSSLQMAGEIVDP
jgi:hypothetical protein